MSTHQHLNRLLDQFNAATLGDGDPIAGANLLAAMACTLANLASPGSGLQSKDGRVLIVGTNLLASGSLVSSLVTNDVTIPVGRCQDNLLQQLNRLWQKDEAEASNTTPRQWHLSRGSNVNLGEHALLQLMTRDPDMPPLIGSTKDEWKSVLSSPPSQGFEDLIQRPRVFISTHSSKQLKKLIYGSHLGEALVSIGLSRKAETAKFGDLCPALMDGNLPAGPSGQGVRARLLVTDQGRVLRDVAAAPNDQNSWLARLVWLVDGTIGSEQPDIETKGDEVIQLDDVQGRFEQAVIDTVAHRLDTETNGPLVYVGDITASQRRWIKFLAKQEQTLPGISGIARHLFSSLVFGLRSLVRSVSPSEGFKYYIEGIEALAQFLVERMAAMRNELLWCSEKARREQLKTGLLRKLADGPQETRALARRFHRLTTGECKDLLLELEEVGDTIMCEGRWELTYEGESFRRLK